MNTLWQKGKPTEKKVLDFTSGNDRLLDRELATVDVLGSIAHITMLASVGLLKKEECAILKKELQTIYREIENQQFDWQDGVEDVHSQIELALTKRVGEVGKKIHSGRSRNDQVITDIKLWLRYKIEEVVSSVSSLFDLAVKKSDETKHILLPGYTHFQPAMPSSFGLWFGAYAESLLDDLQHTQATYHLINRNPLGSAAGYGSSFPLDRKLTTALLGFDDLHYNSVYAQMSRGKTEKITAYSLSLLASTLSKWAMDACLFMSPEFGFISFPDHLTTGSSIMPHKKNPDVLEIIRARCNQLASLPNEIQLITTNLPSGYHRDFQLIKEKIIPAFDTLITCFDMMQVMMQEVRVNENSIADKKYTYLFSVERVNELVLQGMPFRDAYKKVGEEIESHTFNPNTNLHHTHIGSIHNLCLDALAERKENILIGFQFERSRQIKKNLLN